MDLFPVLGTVTHMYLNGILNSEYLRAKQVRSQCQGQGPRRNFLVESKPGARQDRHGPALSPPQRPGCSHPGPVISPDTLVHRVKQNWSRHPGLWQQGRKPIPFNLQRVVGALNCEHRPDKISEFSNALPCFVSNNKPGYNLPFLPAVNASQRLKVLAHWAPAYLFNSLYFKYRVSRDLQIVIPCLLFCLAPGPLSLNKSLPI